MSCATCPACRAQRAILTVRACIIRRIPNI
jgi:hypothetical protein